MADGQVRRIGIISDTHGSLRDEAVDALRESDLIVHAGDVGKGPILEQLSQLAPVIAVRGNVDRDGSPAELPLTAIAEAGSDFFYILHDIETLDLNPAAAGFRAVIYGHSHKPMQTVKAGVLYLNPGSAGPRRFNLPVTIARMDLEDGQWSVRFVDLLSGFFLPVRDLTCLLD